MATVPQHEVDRRIDFAQGKLTALAAEAERRGKHRLPFTASVALVLLEPDSRCGRPMALQALDLSYGGICVVSRIMMYPGSRGALQLSRTNGQMAIVGVQVQHCDYVGEMLHHVGFKFIPLAEELDARAFLDRHGRMVALDQALKP